MKESKNKIATLKKCKGYVIIEMFDTERKKKVFLPDHTI